MLTAIVTPERRCEAKISCRLWGCPDLAICSCGVLSLLILLPHYRCQEVTAVDKRGLHSAQAGNISPFSSCPTTTALLLELAAYPAASVWPQRLDLLRKLLRWSTTSTSLFATAAGTPHRCLRFLDLRSRPRYLRFFIRSLWFVSLRLHHGPRSDAATLDPSSRSNVLMAKRILYNVLIRACFY